MKANEYQKAALRTLNPEIDQLINGGLGLAGEAGECADIIKKHKCQGHPLKTEKLAEELGDVMWYVASTAHAIGYDLETVLNMNIQKLMSRYPEGFSSEKSINRKDCINEG